MRALQASGDIGQKAAARILALGRYRTWRTRGATLLNAGDDVDSLMVVVAGAHAVGEHARGHADDGGVHNHIGDPVTGHIIGGEYFLDAVGRAEGALPVAAARVSVAEAPLTALQWDVRALRAHLSQRPRARAALASAMGKEMARRLLDAAAAVQEVAARV